MDKETILAKSRQENKDKDLYELSVEAKACRAGFFAAEVATILLLLVKVILTGEWDVSLLIIDATMEAVYNFYMAIKLKQKKAFAIAIILTIVDVAIVILEIFT